MSPDDPGVTQPFVLACPYCHGGMRGKLHTLVGRLQPDLISEDFTIVAGEGTPEDAAVTVATDVPVHVSLLRGRAADIMLTPFIQMTSSLGMENISNLMERIGGVRSFRETGFPIVRRAGEAFVRGDLPTVGKVLAESQPAGEDDAVGQIAPLVLLGAAFMWSFASIEDEGLLHAACAEKDNLMTEAARLHPAQVVGLLSTLKSHWLTEHSNRVTDTALSVLGDVEPLISALFAEQIAGTADLADYRVMRDDFDVLKSRYQDIFELGSRSLVFLAQVANIAIRGDAQHHVNGKKLSIEQALGAKAYAREPWLSDLPVAKQMYDAVKRHTRNQIGHRSVRYDFERGILVYDDGVEENYLLFLVDYLQAVRLMHYMLEVVFKLLRAIDTLELAQAGGFPSGR
jgi:hypothetical protein